MNPKDRRPAWHEPDFWRWAIDAADARPKALAQWFPEVGAPAWDLRKATAAAEFGIEFPYLTRSNKVSWPCDPPDGWPVRAEAAGVPQSASAAVSQPQEPLTTEEKVERDREVSRLREQLSETNRRYNTALKEQNVFERLLDEGTHALIPVAPACPPPAHPDREKVTRQALQLSWADWHVDATVSYEIMEGLNWYDPAVALRRVECCVDKTLLIADLNDRIDYHVLYVHDLGDNVENEHHEDAKSTNSMTPMKAARFAAELKAVALRDLAARFERVVYRGIPGNHGRTKQKMPWRLPTENFDWLIYQWVKVLCRDLPNVEFELVDAWSQTCEVEGWGWFLNHGTTDAKGGFGGVSWYSLIKSDTKRTAMDVKLNRKVLAREYGHLHQEANVERAGGNGRIFINPSLKGGDEFPKEGMSGTYSEPGQVLRSVHQREGIVAEYPLNIRQYDLNEECRYDALLELV